MTINEQIARIRVKNFRCLDELIISFEDSPIVALSAGNDSGKSSVVKAIETIMYNDERDDKNYIRTGTKGFEIDVEFTDGVKVSRIKTAASNMYYLYDATGKEVGRWGSGTGDAKLGAYGIPDIVKTIFNVKLDDATGELLNLRTCESLLLFSLTKTTDNYKMVHSCISSHRIEKAYEIGNQHIKDATKELDQATNIRDYNRDQAKKIVTLPDETLDKLVANKQQLEAMLAQISKVVTVMNEARAVAAKQQELDRLGEKQIKQLEVSKPTDKEIALLTELENCSFLLKNITAKRHEAQSDKVEELLKHDITSADIDTLRQLDEATTLLHRINDLMSSSYDPSSVANLDELYSATSELNAQLQNISECIRLRDAIAASEKDLELYDKLSKAEAEMTKQAEIKTSIADILTKKSEIEAKNKELQSLDTELKTLQSKLLASGGIKYDAEKNALIKNCEHCNEEVAFSLTNLQLV